jgi:hypothetical protein
VTITTAKPFGFLLRGAGSIPIVCAKGIQNRAALAKATDGSGPYVLTEAVPNDHYTLTRRNGYTWGHRWRVHQRQGDARHRSSARCTGCGDRHQPPGDGRSQRRHLLIACAQLRELSEAARKGLGRFGAEIVPRPPS